MYTRLISILPIFLLIISTALKYHECHDELFSSTDQLVRLVPSLSNTPKHLYEFLKLQNKKVPNASKIIKDIKSIAIEARKDAKKFMSHPVNAYIVIKTLTKDLWTFYNYFNNTETEPFEWLENLGKLTLLPSNDDYKGAIDALNRLQDIYLLTEYEIQQGSFLDFHSFRSLDAFECVEIGLVRYHSDEPYDAIAWLKESLRTLKTDKSDKSIKKSTVLDYLSDLYLEIGDLFTAHNLTQQIIQLEPDEEHFQLKLQSLEALISRYYGSVDVSKVEIKELEDTNFERDLHLQRSSIEFETEGDFYKHMCRGDLLFKTDQKNLKCRYESGHAYLVIGPIKEEQVSIDPPIWVYHDVITQRDADEMIKLAKPLEKSDSNPRMSQTGWIKDELDDFLSRLSSLLGAIKNLNTKNSMPWQINNYGLGGAFVPHEDFYEDNDDQSNSFKPIATWMLYIEAPELGGATVFPSIGVHITPVSRSAVFWYNLLPSGEGDYRTRHAACPVIVGSKWVGNKWLESEEQIFSRPCGLTREENKSAYRPTTERVEDEAF